MYFIKGKPLNSFITSIEGASISNTADIEQSSQTRLTLTFSEDDQLNKARVALHFRAYEDRSDPSSIKVCRDSDPTDVNSISLIANLRPEEMLGKLGISKDKVSINLQEDGIGEYEETLLTAENMPAYPVKEPITKKDLIEMHHQEALHIEGCFVNGAIKHKNPVVFTPHGTALSFDFSCEKLESDPINAGISFDCDSKQLMEEAMRRILVDAFGDSPPDIIGSHITFGYELEVDKLPDTNDVKVSIQFWNETLLEQFIPAFSLERDYEKTLGHGYNAVLMGDNAEIDCPAMQ